VVVMEASRPRSCLFVDCAYVCQIPLPLLTTEDVGRVSSTCQSYVIGIADTGGTKVSICMMAVGTLERKTPQRGEGDVKRIGWHMKVTYIPPPPIRCRRVWETPGEAKLVKTR